MLEQGGWLLKPPDIAQEVAGLHWQGGPGQLQLLRQHLLILGGCEHIGRVETSGELRQRTVDARAAAEEVQAARSADHDGQCEHLVSAQGVHIPVEIGACGLGHPSSLAGIRNLIEIELEDGGFRKACLKMPGLKPFDPARPHRARPWVQQADDLLGDGTGAANRTPGVEVLPQRVQPRRPIHASVCIKAFIFGSNEGLLQEERDLVQRDVVMHIPGILERDREGETTAVHHLGSTDGRVIWEKR